jgi:hypothetical protein
MAILESLSLLLGDDRNSSAGYVCERPEIHAVGLPPRSRRWAIAKRFRADVDCDLALSFDSYRRTPRFVRRPVAVGTVEMRR